MKPEDAEVLALQEHRTEITESLRQNGFSSEKIREIENSLDAFQVPKSVPNLSDLHNTLKSEPISQRHREAIENGFTDAEKNHGINVDARAQHISLAEGGEIYQTYEYDKLPPVKYIENRGLRIRSGAEYEPRYRIEAHEQELNHENEVLKEEIGKK